ncbi:MAG: hypothetical protein AAB405_01575 [Patescibacteria group bacterium]
MDKIFSHPIFLKIKELIDLLVILINKILQPIEKLLLWLWDIFSGVFMTILQFTIDIIKFILNYFN